jgi:hypothetical protein
LFLNVFHPNAMHSLQKLIFLLFVSFLYSCDKGLAPPPLSGISTLSGTIHFKGTPKDSVQTLLVVLVEAKPPFLASYLLAGAVNGSILATSLSTTFHDTAYSLVVKPDTTYSYLAVAQKYGYDVTKDWHAVAFAHDANDSALTFTLIPGEQKTGVDLFVNFDSLPRQPFIQ